MRQRLLNLLPMLMLLALLVPRAQASQAMCCYGKINLPIDQGIAPYEKSSPFGFTVYTTPLPPYFIYLNLTVEYEYSTYCFGGAVVLGDSTISGSGAAISQVNMLVSKFSLLTGQWLGTIQGFAVGPPDGYAGPPEWFETGNTSGPCPQPR